MSRKKSTQLSSLKEILIQKISKEAIKIKKDKHENITSSFMVKIKVYPYDRKKEEIGSGIFQYVFLIKNDTISPSLKLLIESIHKSIARNDIDRFLFKCFIYTDKSYQKFPGDTIRLQDFDENLDVPRILRMIKFNRKKDEFVLDTTIPRIKYHWFMDTRYRDREKPYQWDTEKDSYPPDMAPHRPLTISDFDSDLEGEQYYMNLLNIIYDTSKVDGFIELQEEFKKKTDIDLLDVIEEYPHILDVVREERRQQTFQEQILERLDKLLLILIQNSCDDNDDDEYDDYD